MFDMESQPTIVKSVVESAGSGIESADSTADSAIIPLKIGLWVWVFSKNTKFTGRYYIYVLMCILDY